MSQDLYSKLGLDKNASADDLKRSYRKKAAEVHPDHGGDPEDFKALVKAYKILENPETRKRYDSGEDPDKMNSGATAQDEVTLLVISLYADVVDQTDPNVTNIISVMLIHLAENERQITSEISKAQKRLKKYETAAKRTIRKQGHNLLAEMMLNKVGEVNREIQEFERQRGLRTKARDIIQSYDYFPDEQKPLKVNLGGFSVGIDFGTFK